MTHGSSEQSQSERGDLAGTPWNLCWYFYTKFVSFIKPVNNKPSYSMSGLLKKLTLFTLVAALLVAPLQLVAGKRLSSSAGSDTAAQMVVNQQESSMAHDCCEPCDQNCCMDDNTCANGHCSSVHAGLLSLYSYSHEAVVQMVSVDYIDRLSLSYPSNLFRPPRA